MDHFFFIEPYVHVLPLACFFESLCSVLSVRQSQAKVKARVALTTSAKLSLISSSTLSHPLLFFLFYIFSFSFSLYFLYFPLSLSYFSLFLSFSPSCSHSFPHFLFNSHSLFFLSVSRFSSTKLSFLLYLTLEISSFNSGTFLSLALVSIGTIKKLLGLHLHAIVAHSMFWISVIQIFECLIVYVINGLF